MQATLLQDNYKGTLTFRNYVTLVCEVLTAWNVQPSKHLTVLLSVLEQQYNVPDTLIWQDAELCFDVLQSVKRTRKGR